MSQSDMGEMRALGRRSALTSPIALRLGPLLSRFAGEDNSLGRRQLLLRGKRAEFEPNLHVLAKLAVAGECYLAA